MITGYPNPETLSEALRLGAFDCLEKPVTQRILLDVTDRALRHRAQEIADLRRSPVLHETATDLMQAPEDVNVSMNTGNKERIEVAVTFVESSLSMTNALSAKPWRWGWRPGSSGGCGHEW